jgi:hypothetical protein
MTNYQFRETITGDDGDEVAFPILVHELYSKPYKLEGVPEWASDDEIERGVAQLEEKLGYELERPDDYDEVRLSDEEAAEYHPKSAGFDPITGEFRAQ